MSPQTLRQDRLQEPELQPQGATDADIADALMLLFRLPEEAIATISESKRGLQVSFAEAALHSGLVTHRELDQAMEWVHRNSSKQGRSIVEDALRMSASSRRELVLWEGERLSPGKQLILAHEPYNPRSETVRSLRTELLMRTSERRGAAAFAMLSVNSGDGRSQLAAELALAFAQLGSRTLLVDADLRNPRQHVLFGADNQIGLAQALMEGGSGRMHGINGLQQMALLTAGSAPPNPLELLSGSAFGRLMTEWRRSFEYIVIDTPAMSSFSDCLPVATAAANVLVLGRRNETSFKGMAELQRKLAPTHARIIGAVLNDF